jgi:hypothetical protein
MDQKIDIKQEVGEVGENATVTGVEMHIQYPYFQARPVGLSRSFDSLIAERTRNFIGREFVLKERFIHARTVMYNANYHIVWTVKSRRNVLVDGVEGRLKELLHEIAQDKGFLIQNLEVLPDHVHVFASGHPKLSAS